MAGDPVPEPAGQPARCAKEVRRLKLIVAIVPADDAGGIVDGLTQQEFGVTRINTVSGFLKKGNATLLVGVDDGKVSEALDLIASRARKGRTFVLDVERYERL